jgi:hypothetical protein
MMTIVRKRPARLEGAPLEHALENELSVVFRFSRMAKRKLGVHVEHVAARYPDCLATLDDKQLRIEEKALTVWTGSGELTDRASCTVAAPSGYRKGPGITGRLQARS